MNLETAAQSSDSLEEGKDNELIQKIKERFLYDDEFARGYLEVWFGEELFSSEGEDGLESAIDLPQFQERFKRSFKASHRVNIPKFDVLKRLSEITRGRKFIDLTSRDSQQEPKELIYMPRSYEEAFDEGEIKSTSFHVLPSELIQRNSFGSLELETEDGESKDVHCLEIEFAALLFHPDYCNGFRNRKGDLMVYDSTVGKYVKFTYKFMERMGFNSKVFRRTTAEHGYQSQSIWTGMQARLPNIIDQGLLREGDIKEMSLRRIDDAAFKSIEKSPISVGNVVYNGVVHHIGRRFSPKERPDIKVKNLSEHRGLVLDEQGYAEVFFNLYNKSDSEVKDNNGKYSGTVGIKATNPRSINYGSLVGPRSGDETELEYDGRVASIKKGVTDFYTKVLPGLEVADEFVDRVNDSETTGLSSVAYWLAKQDKTEALRQFGKQFGAHGLRSFVRLGTKESSADQILEFAKEQPVVAEKLFAAHAALLDIANQAESILHEQVDCSVYDCSELVVTVRNNVFGQAEALLFGALTQENPELVLTQLEQFSSDAKLYVSLLRTVGVERLLVNPLEHVLATELTEQMRQEMSQIQVENYNRLYPELKQKQFKEKVFASLRNSFNQKNTEFYYLQHDEKIVSFNRFDWFLDEVDGRQMVYFGSFNADQAYRGVGGILLEQALQEQLEKADVMMAHCDPYLDIGKKYIESGFVAKNLEDFEGEPTFEIWRTKDIGLMLKTKQMDIESLVDATTGEQDGFMVREVHMNDSFPELEPDSHFLLTRYFTYGSKSYAAFEVPSAELWNLLRPAQRGRAQEAA